MVKIFEGPVWLDPVPHVYIHRDTGAKYTSVTTILGMVVPEFDEVAVAGSIERMQDHRKKEEYIGLSQEQLLDYWQFLNDTANEYGTFVHETIEEYLFKQKWWFPKDEFQRKIIAGYESLKIDEGECMWPERIMFAEEYALAGMSDLVIDIDDVWFDIGDWKTNKRFDFHNRFGNEPLLKPFEHLQHCHYVEYSIQLSTYALMYELETGRKCRQIFIGYWDQVTETMSRIPIMYMKNEARKLLELHKYNTQYN